MFRGFSLPVCVLCLVLTCGRISALDLVLDDDDIPPMQVQAILQAVEGQEGGLTEEGRTVRAEDNHFGIKPQDLVKSQILVIEWGNEDDRSRSLLLVRPGPGPVLSGLVITRHQETKGLEYRVVHAARVFANGNSLVFDCQDMACFGPESPSWSPDSMLLDLEKRTVQTKDDSHPGGNNGKIISQVFREGKDAAEYRRLQFLIDCILSGML